MPKILVVEDDKFFREAICDVLNKKNYTVQEAPSGKAAREILSVQDFDLVLTDIQMPGLTGLELLEWTLKVKPQIPFVIMTGFSMILETKSAYDLGAKGFISKPFKNSELLEIIEGILGPVHQKKEFQVVTVADEYCKVSIEEFVTRPQLDFDVFVQLSEKKYIKIAHKGDTIPKEKVHHYKEKGVRHLYISKADFGKLVQFNLNVAELIKNRDGITQEKRMKFIKYTGEVLLEKAFVAGIDRRSFNEAQTFLGLTFNALSESDESMDLLDLLNSHSDAIYAHSLGVSIYSVMIARKLNYESNLILFKLSLAGMFHDIGKKEIERTILEKPRHLLSTAERKLVESHVVRSQDILRAVKGVPEDVIQIVYEHHEDPVGQGYPMAKVKKNLHPLSRIVQVANLFMENVLKGPQSPGMTGPAAVEKISRIYMDRVDTEALNALKSLFQE